MSVRPSLICRGCIKATQAEVKIKSQLLYFMDHWQCNGTSRTWPKHVFMWALIYSPRTTIKYSSSMIKHLLLEVDEAEWAGSEPRENDKRSMSKQQTQWTACRTTTWNYKLDWLPQRNHHQSTCHELQPGTAWPLPVMMYLPSTIPSSHHHHHHRHHLGPTSRQRNQSTNTAVLRPTIHAHLLTTDAIYTL